MAALQLKDLIAAQQRLKAKEEQSAATTTMSMEDLNKLIQTSDESTGESKNETKAAKKRQETQQAKQTEVVSKSLKEIKQGLDENTKLLKKGLLDKSGDGLNANVIKLADILKKQAKGVVGGVPAVSKAGAEAPTQPGASQNAAAARERAGQILEERSKEQAGRYVPGTKDWLKENFNYEGGGLKGIGKAIKKSFSLEGVLDMSEGKNMGGFLGGELRNKVQKKQYARDRLATEKGRMLNLPEYQGEEGKERAQKIFERQYDEQRAIRGSMAENEGEVERLRKGGFADKDIKRAGLFAKREELDKSLRESDPQYRAQRKLDEAGLTPVKPTKAKPKASTKPEAKALPTPEATDEALALPAPTKGKGKTKALPKPKAVDETPTLPSEDVDTPTEEPTKPKAKGRAKGKPKSATVIPFPTPEAKAPVATPVTTPAIAPNTAPTALLAAPMPATTALTPVADAEEIADENALVAEKQLDATKAVDKELEKHTALLQAIAAKIAAPVSAGGGGQQAQGEGESGGSIFDDIFNAKKPSSGAGNIAKGAASAGTGLMATLGTDVAALSAGTVAAGVTVAAGAGLAIGYGISKIPVGDGKNVGDWLGDKFYSWSGKEDEDKKRKAESDNMNNVITQTIKDSKDLYQKKYGMEKDEAPRAFYARMKVPQNLIAVPVNTADDVKAKYANINKWLEQNYPKGSKSPDQPAAATPAGKAPPDSGHVANPTPEQINPKEPAAVTPPAAASAPVETPAAAPAPVTPPAAATPTPAPAPVAAAPTPAPAPAKPAAPAPAPVKPAAPATPAAPAKAAAPTAATSSGKDWSTGTGGEKMNAETKAKILKMPDEDAKKAIAAWRVITDPKVSSNVRTGAGEILAGLIEKNNPKKAETAPATPATPAPTPEAPTGKSFLGMGSLVQKGKSVLGIDDAVQPAPTNASQVYQQSSENAAASSAPPAPAPVIVNAPVTTNTNPTTTVVPSSRSARNTESSVSEYNRGRFWG